MEGSRINVLAIGGIIKKKQSVISCGGVVEIC